MVPIIAGLFACSDYTFDEGKPFVPGGDEEEEPPPEPSENPDIQIEPSLTEFGFVGKGCSSGPEVITITNIGLDNLAISNIKIAGDGGYAFPFSHSDLADSDGVDNNADGQVDEEGETSIITLSYGESTTVTVSFTPDLYRDFDVDFQVISNDPDETVATADVTGIGADGEVFEETFSQEFNDAVDVLWVIDNSGSMSGKIEHVKNNFDSFLGTFLGAGGGLDYKMAITTTDVANNGSFMGTTPILDSNMSQSAVETAFGNTLDLILDVEGSADEKGLQATHAAFTNNPSFIRSGDVGLSVIIISDEDDSGSTPSGTSFISWFQGLKPTDPTLAKVHAFLDNSNSVFGGNTIYEEVINATGGLISEVSGDYEQQLQEIAMVAAGLSVSFPLSEVPNPESSISVNVGSSVISQGINSGWTYNSNTNMITFHGNSIPEVGQDVIVTYSLATECN